MYSLSDHVQFIVRSMQVQHDFHRMNRRGKRSRMSWVWKDLYSNALYSPLYDGCKHGSSPSSKRDPSSRTEVYLKQTNRAYTLGASFLQ